MCSSDLPGPAFLVVLQLARGLVFTGILATLARNLRGSRLAGALAAGIAFSLLGGILPLLVPNPYMPASIRWPHMVETASSGLVFGVLTGWLLGRAPRR